MTTIVVTLAQDGGIKLQFPYDKGLVDRLAVFGNARTWDKAARCWYLPAAKFPILLKHFTAEVSVHPDVWLGLPIDVVERVNLVRAAPDAESVAREKAYLDLLAKHGARWRQDAIRKREMIDKKRAEGRRPEQGKLIR